MIPESKLAYSFTRSTRAGDFLETVYADSLKQNEAIRLTPNLRSSFFAIDLT